MKILFVCRANVGRSQMAESIFKKLSKKHQVESAGVSPGKWEGKTLHEATHVLPSLKEIDIVADENISKKITEDKVINNDIIIVIGVDKNTWPEYLKESKKVEFWDIEDPAHGDMDIHRKARDKIKQKVKELIEELDKKNN